ncbi:MAG: glycoside hydrolase family 43 protein [Dysgonomonas sp.]
MKKRFTFCSLSAILALCLLAGCRTVKETQPTQVYLFSYFINNGEDGLHLAYSTDGQKWNAMNNGQSYLAPRLGKDMLMRDPSIVQDDKGVFHMVWTTGWWDQGIGYASSKDLKNWSQQKEIPVMESFKGTKNAWAPELFYDRDTKMFYIFWASTIPGAFPDIKDSKTEKDLNHRQYYVTTKDFVTFSDTKLYFEPGFSVIDGSILKKDKTYYLFLKNETPEPAEKNIRVTSNNKPYDFPTKVSAPITGNYWAEGPSPLQVGEYVYVYFDKYIDHKYGAVRSKDLKTWEDVSDLVSFPSGTRHGTAFAVSQNFFDQLIGK